MKVVVRLHFKEVEQQQYLLGLLVVLGFLVHLLLMVIRAEANSCSMEHREYAYHSSGKLGLVRVRLTIN
jgi:hypothetical protein